VERIQESLNRPMSTFITFYRDKDFEQLLTEDDQRYLFRTKHGPVAMCLSRVRLPDDELGCVFLKGNLCSIHQYRPLVCRQYPFQPQDRTDIEGPFQLMAEPCFGKHAEDEIVDETPVRKNYRLFQEQQEEYLNKVKSWNADPSSSGKDIEDFLTLIELQWS
jgi:Fe-S-cluster containining protein